MQRPVIGKDGKPVTEEREITIPAFKVVSVFDVSQTEGKELPDIAVDALTGDVDKYKEFFAALEKTAPVPIGIEKMESGTHGYYHLENKRIAISEGMSELQTLKTTIHEIAHAKLHDVDLKDPVAEQQNRPDRRTREVEAESIAYTVCQHYGLDTSDYSFGYVAGWSSGKELAELINTIDGHIAQIQKEQTAEQKQTPVFAKLSPENQGELSDAVRDAIQMLVDKDLELYGEVSSGTLKAIDMQGFTYQNGNLARVTAQEQPGLEKWSEPATAEIAPENPGTPSDDVSAYLPPQDNTFSIYQLKHGD